MCSDQRVRDARRRRCARCPRCARCRSWRGRAPARSSRRRTRRRWRSATVIGVPPSVVPTAPCGRISACFWMLSSIVLTNSVSSARTARTAVADRALVLQARLRADLLDGVAGRDGGRVRGRADEAAETRDVGRRHFEAGAGQAERAEVGHVRRAESAAHRARAPSRTRPASPRRDARNVTLDAVSESSGQSGCTVDERAVGGAAPCTRAPPKRSAPSEPQPIGPDVERGLHVHAALGERRAVGNARTARRDRAASTGFTLNASEVSRSKYTSPPSAQCPRARTAASRTPPGTPWTVVRSGSWPIVAVGLPLPPWFTRSSRWLLSE